MSAIPAHCPHCGLFFLETGFANFGTAAGITFKGSQVSCPRCRRLAKILDGTYDFVGDATRLKDAPAETLAFLQSIQDAIRSIDAGVPPETVVAALETVSPEVAKIAQSAILKGGASLLGAILVVLATSCSANVTATLNINQLVDQARFYIAGGDPYPIAEQTASLPASSAEAPGLSRQQRRQQERQSKKQTPPVVQPSPRKPRR